MQVVQVDEVEPIKDTGLVTIWIVTQSRGERLSAVTVDLSAVIELTEEREDGELDAPSGSRRWVSDWEAVDGD